LETFADDIQKIVSKFAENGYEVSPEDACRAWEEYSDGYCASWLNMGDGPRHSEFQVLKGYFVEVAE